MVINLARDNLVNYKKKIKNNKNVIDFNRNLILRNSYDKNITNFKEIANFAFDYFKKNFPKFESYKLL